MSELAPGHLRMTVRIEVWASDTEILPEGETLKIECVEPEHVDIKLAVADMQWRVMMTVRERLMAAEEIRKGLLEDAIAKEGDDE